MVAGQELALVEFPIQPRVSQQLTVRSTIDQLAVVEDQDDIRRQYAR